MTLEDLGWNGAFAKEWEACMGTAKGWVPARLIRDNKISYGALTGEGETAKNARCPSSAVPAAITKASLASIPNVTSAIGSTITEQESRFGRFSDTPDWNSWVTGIPTV